MDLSFSSFVPSIAKYNAMQINTTSMYIYALYIHMWVSINGGTPKWIV